MLEIINSIRDWPVILQGALGSAAFWLTLFICQKSYILINANISRVSKNIRKSELINERVRISLVGAKGIKKAHVASALLYRMSRPLLKAFIWLVLGLLFGQLFNVLSVVGYLGSIYYLIKALDIVKAVRFEGDVAKRLEGVMVKSCVWKS